MQLGSAVMLLMLNASAMVLYGLVLRIDLTMISQSRVGRSSESSHMLPRLVLNLVLQACAILRALAKIFFQARISLAGVRISHSMRQIFVQKTVRTVCAMDLSPME
jgi:hypothetical protein